MPYLIDGHNLIGKLAHISLHDIDDEIWLFELLEDYFKNIRKKAIIFFDRGNLSNKQSKNGAFVKAKFIRKPSSADEAIILELRRLKGNAKNYIVVSSDNWVLNSAKSAGANTEKSEIFAKKLSQDQKTSKKPAKNDLDDTEYWLNVFTNGS